MSKISVIVSTYNYAQYFPKCLDSTLSQTRKPDEVLVIDDCSIDNTAEIIKPYGQKVCYLRHKRNWGNVCRTFNQGIKKAHGDYILIISADDWLRIDMLEREAAILDTNPEVGLVYAQTFTVKGIQKERVIHSPAGKTSYIGRGQDFELLLTSGNFIPAPTVLVRKNVYRKLGLFDVNLPLTADYDMWIRIARNYSLAYIAEPLAYYRVHGKNIHLMKKGSKKGWRREWKHLLIKYLPNDKSSSSQSLRRLTFRNYYIWLAIQEANEANFVQTKDFWLKSMQLKPNYLLKWSTWQPLYFFIRQLIGQFIKKVK